MARGKFITVEGTEGVGKSTNIEFVKDRIIDAGIDLIVTREPGGTPLAEELRALLLSNRAELFDPMAELLVIFAARAQHIAQVIEPALKSGKWVISDRFTDATFAYQGAGRGLSKSAIETLEKLVQGELQPDKTLLLDIDVTVGLERVKNRELDRFELEKVDFFERVRLGYKERVQRNPNRFAIIDAGQPLDHVQRQLQVAVDNMLNDKNKE